MGGAASAQHGKKGKGKATGDELISRVSRACRETNEGTAAAKESAWAALAVDMPLLAKRVEDNPRVLMDAGPLFMTVTHFLGNTLAAAPTEVVKRCAMECLMPPALLAPPPRVRVRLRPAAASHSSSCSPA